MLKLIALILPLGLDSFAIAAALGLAGLPAQQRPRGSITFAAFEAGMPLIGLALGAPLGTAIGQTASYIAIAVLIALGLYTVLRSEEAEEQQVAQLASVHGPTVLLLGLSVSVDELAIGFTLGLLGLPIIPALLLIGAQVLILSQLGLRLGTRISTRAREGAERLAGIALTLIGLALLAE